VESVEAKNRRNRKQGVLEERRGELYEGEGEGRTGGVNLKHADLG